MSSGSVVQQQLEMLTQELQRSSDSAVLFNQAVATGAGIHPTDLKVLSLLSRYGALSAGRIAELTGLTTGAVTFMIDRLEKVGYARRVRNPKDRRSVLIELNLESIESDIRRHFTQMDQAVKEVVEHYNDAELAIVLDFMTRMNEAAERVITQLSKEE
jgi:DNA-binding MarR family transcriptional regulator